MLCPFNGCMNLIEPGYVKCANHKHRKQCQNQVYARGYCVRHGGKRTCIAPNCTRNVRAGEYCLQHNNDSKKKNICIELGCANVAHSRRKCVRHGGGRQCQVTGCPTHARSGGTCHRHSRIHSSREGALQDTLIQAIDDVLLNDELQCLMELSHTNSTTYDSIRSEFDFIYNL